MTFFDRGNHHAYDMFMTQPIHDPPQTMPHLIDLMLDLLKDMTHHVRFNEQTMHLAWMTILSVVGYLMVRWSMRCLSTRIKNLLMPSIVVGDPNHERFSTWQAKATPASETKHRPGFHCNDDNKCVMVPYAADAPLSTMDRFLLKFTPDEIDFMNDYPELKSCMKPPIEFDQLVREAQIGDILVVRGHMPYSIVIQHVQNLFRGSEPITHVGMIMNHSLINDRYHKHDHDLVILESAVTGIATDSVPDVAGNPINGVQLRWLRDQMLAKENHHSIFGWLRLAPEYREKIRQKQQQGLMPFHRGLAKYIGYPYPHVPNKFVAGLFIDMPMLASVMEDWLDDENQIFCSHLVTLMYQDEEIIDSNVQANRIFPVDIVCDNPYFPRLWDQFRIIRRPG